MHVRYAVAIREEYELNTFIVFDYYPISAGVYCKHHTYPRYIGHRALPIALRSSLGSTADLPPL